ncbi:MULTISPECIES: alpha/beta hydrolase [unclassified Sphingomonas]|uniref:alpha/beta hydrolase n=1 Tax=unclassified Sphingomonas TaxID=196159 RepID=UPI0009287B89|nr:MULTISPECIES: alpha/beta hydrolase [unclassified Sphingomonas]MBN8847090.1 alpha/beta hydrolase [Sphingomonas sp.]OJV33182.1 MAG: arylesterase [Sphingomonas sp. 67-36]
MDGVDSSRKAAEARSADGAGLIDPELRAFLEAQPTIDITIANLALVREAPLLPPAPRPDVAIAISRQLVPGPDGAPDIPVLIYRPEGADGALGCIFHIHGGGYVAGTAAAMEPANLSLADALGCAVVSVDYRLAPETPFPGPLHDCHAALRWLAAHAPDLGIDPAAIGVLGESAGGGLAAALALLDRDCGERLLAFQHLVYPMLDDRTCVRESAHPFAGRHVWTARSNQFGWASYLGLEPGPADLDYLAAPGRCGNLAGLPPAYISTGALDLFVDEDMDYARRLSRAGVPVELALYPGAVHGFDLLPGTAIGERARRERIAALGRALASARGRPAR